MVREILLLIATVFLCTHLGYANNISVSSVGITGQDSLAKTCKVQFDISWQNSWRDNGAPSQTANYDAAWIFLKYSNDAGNTWKHATLKGNGTNPAGYSIGSGTPIEIKVPNDTAEGNGLGCFIQRSSVGGGPLQTTGIQLVWSWGVDGLLESDSARIQAFAVEMVYIPQGNFHAGSGGTGTDEFTKTQITRPEANQSGGYPTGITPPNVYWPNGYRAFYLMKYEISQGQYRDFLNSLTTTQQNNRGMLGAAGLFFTRQEYTNTTPSNRNGIQKQASGYVCNLDNDATYNEPEDGEWIACNWLSWWDLAAYLDWAAMRPMTELEFEKACRSPIVDPVADEYAWGSRFLVNANTLISVNIGRDSEAVTELGRGLCNYGNDGVLGPMRGGFAAKTNSTRAESGAGYYGNMELSGNLRERTIEINYVSYTGVHGDGILTASGDVNIATWPPTGASGIKFRGGSWNDASGSLRVSDRGIGGDPSRYLQFGGRGARTGV